MEVFVIKLNFGSGRWSNLCCWGSSSWFGVVSTGKLSWKTSGWSSGGTWSLRSSCNFSNSSLYLSFNLLVNNLSHFERWQSWFLSSGFNLGSLLLLFDDNFCLNLCIGYLSSSFNSFYTLDSLLLGFDLVNNLFVCLHNFGDNLCLFSSFCFKSNFISLI